MPNRYITRHAIFPVGPSIAYLYLSTEQYALVDWDIAVWGQQFLWTAKWNKHTQSFYPRRRVRIPNDLARSARYQYASRMLHSEVMPAPVGLLTDHINGNSLDARRANLRYATPRQNACNRAPRRGQLSGVKGVCWHKGSKKWQAAISLGTQRCYLGLYDTVQEAAVAYAAKARELHGEFARVGAA